RHAQRSPRRARRRDGPLRLRQVDADAHPRRAGQAERGKGRDRRPGDHVLRDMTNTSGEKVEFAGREITSLGDTDVTKLRREHIGFVFQFFNLLPMLNAEENVLLPLSIAGEKPDKAWVAELMKKIGLQDRRTHRPSELSGGQQQRVAIGRALVSRPTIVFADEPTGNLDSRTSAEILELMRDSVDGYGQTTVM